MPALHFLHFFELRRVRNFQVFPPVEVSYVRVSALFFISVKLIFAGLQFQLFGAIVKACIVPPRVL